MYICQHNFQIQRIYGVIIPSLLRKDCIRNVSSSGTLENLRVAPCGLPTW